MSNVEHLIENAIIALERNKKYEDFADQKYNVTMANQSNIKLEDIWAMAIHVVYVFKASWVSDTVAIFQGETPFDLDMREYVERFI